jgi:hypothetical protein
MPDQPGWPVAIRAARVNCGPFTASQSKDIALNWPIPFADTNYTVVATAVEVGGPTANSDAVRQVLTVTAAGITVRVASGATGYADGALFLHAVAVHD